tara:strand:+ start:377 stop:517 length:141 start_codon:yes stop_codon:yes gene_type:complete
MQNSGHAQEAELLAELEVEDDVDEDVALEEPNPNREQFEASLVTSG